MKCAVIIPFSSAQEELVHRCIESVKNEHKQRRGDLTSLAIYPVHYEDEKNGFPEACNTGVKHAHASGCQWVFFIKPSQSVAENIFQRITPYLHTYDGIWGQHYFSTPHAKRMDARMNSNDVLILDTMVIVSDAFFVRTAIALQFSCTVGVGEDAWIENFLLMWDRILWIKINSNLCLPIEEVDEARINKQRHGTRLLAFKHVFNIVQRCRQHLHRSVVRQSSPPCYFTLTGVSKSGNTWLGNMLWDITGIKGFPKNHPGNRLPSLENFISKHTQTKDVAILQPVIKGILNPNDPSFDQDNGILLKKSVISSALPFIRLLNNDPSLDASSLFESSGKNSVDVENPNIEAYGLPSKHMDVKDIIRLMPDFNIVHIVRDPRDIIVSYFYHDLAHMREHIIELFVEPTCAEPSSKEAFKMRDDWKKRYFEIKALLLSVFFFNFGQPENDKYILVRYEDLLDTPHQELVRILNFLGLPKDYKNINHVIEKHSFNKITGGDDEQRMSPVRKGVKGDWKNYFDRPMIEALGLPFIRLVTELGYENDNQWVHDLPQTAPKEFDFTRFRLRNSASRSFSKYWFENEDLQKKYPNIADVSSDDNYFLWLQNNQDEEIQRWLKKANHLVNLWNVDIDEEINANRRRNEVKNS